MGSNERLLGELETDRAKIQKEDHKQTAHIASHAFLSVQLMEQIEAKCAQLHKQRKEMKKMKNAYVEYSTHEAISQYNQTVDLQVHKGEGTGVEEDLFAAKLIYTVGTDKHISAFNPSTQKIEGTFTLKGKCTDLLIYNLPGGEDKIDTLLVADESKRLTAVHFNQDTHKFLTEWEIQLDEVAHCLCLHPVGHLVFCLKKDKAWSVVDIHSRKVIFDKPAEKGTAFTAIAVHPDGNLLAVGDNKGKIHFINILSGEEVMDFQTDLVSY